MNTRRLLLTLATTLAGPALACCFMENEPYDYPRIPTAPYEQSALHGLVLPDQAVRNLALAYRSASGVPISELELAALTRVWGNTYGTNTTNDDLLTVTEAWKTEATKVLKSEGTVGPNEMTADYSRYFIANPGAFRRALERLAERKKRYAADPALLAAWTWRQSKVLGVTFPDVPKAKPSASLQKSWDEDLRVFTALEAFYGNQFAEATKAFDALAGTSEGKWAPIDAARAQLRLYTLDKGGDPALNEAERRLRAIKSSDEAITGAARALLLKVRRLRRDFCGELPKLMEKKQGDALPHLLVAFEQGLDGYTGTDWEEFKPNCTQLPELREWLGVFRALRVPGWSTQPIDAPAQTAAQQALEHWKKTPTKAWLLAALTGARGDEADLPALLEAAKAIAPGELMGPTVSLHRARLLRRSGQRDAARALMAELPLEKWPVGVQNFFQLERFQLADSAADASLAMWPRPTKPYEGEVQWSGNTAQVTRSLPVVVMSQWLDATALVALARDAKVPTPVRQSAGWAALSRRVFLGGDLTDAAKALQEADPKAPLKPVLDAKDAATLKGSALRFVLQHAGASVDLLSNVDRAAKDIGATTYERYGCSTLRNGWFPTPPLTPDFAPSWASTLSKEEQQLRADGASKVYPRAAVAFATENPQSPLAPEVLALAVAYSKYASGGDDTKAAFRLLQKNWPKSKWAEATPIFW